MTEDRTRRYAGELGTGTRPARVVLGTYDPAGCFCAAGEMSPPGPAERTGPGTSAVIVSAR
jgi:hypothetical protein